MKQFITILIFLILSIATFCSAAESNFPQLVDDKLVLLSLSEKTACQTELEKDELQRVIHWMNRDILKRMRQEGFVTSFIKDMKEYSSTMGTLTILDVIYFNSAHGNRKKGPFSLEVNYKLLDRRGALLAEWTDGADSRRGGTYCARALNKRAMEKINKLLKNKATPKK